MFDGWELRYLFDPKWSEDYILDPDSDGLNNLQEFDNQTDPWDFDSDNDGVSDGVEVAKGSDPLDPNSVPVADIEMPIILLVASIFLSIAIIIHALYHRPLSLKSSKAPNPSKIRLRVSRPKCFYDRCHIFFWRPPSLDIRKGGIGGNLAAAAQNKATPVPIDPDKFLQSYFCVGIIFVYQIKKVV